MAVLVGVVGTMAAVLSGAFTRATAARQLTFVVPPQQAVRLDPVPPAEVESPSAPVSDAVSEDAEGQQLQVDLDLLVGKIGGLNQDALTTFEPIMHLRNTGGAAVTSVEVQTTVTGTDRPGAHARAIALRVGQGWVTAAHNELVSLRDATVPIPPGEGVPLSIAVDLRPSGLPELDSGVSYRFTLTVGTDRL
ncbi:UNVERIFIED_CONTAM: hypothetical protein BEN50_17385 [Euhalothece sp. KZN 001]